jgi:hypothetical protein
MADVPHIKREGVYNKRKRRQLGQVDWTPLNQEGVDLFVRIFLDVILPCHGEEWSHVQEETIRTINPELSDAVEAEIYAQNPLAVITEYVNGKPRWSAQGSESLEMMYVRFSAGLLSPEEAWSAAGNDCECGNGGFGCFNSEHNKMRAEMEAWTNE